MRWEAFYSQVYNLPVIESKVLKILFVQQNIELQLSRWSAQGKLIQLKKGYYILAEQFRKLPVFEPYIAAVLKEPSYISLEKALEMHNLIPDVVYAITSVTTKRRPAEFVNPLGRFTYSTIKRDYFWGYQGIEMENQKGYLADPEKALLDLFYFKRQKISRDYIRSLRLHHVDLLDMEKLKAYSDRFNVPFVKEAVSEFIRLFNGESNEG